MRASIIIPTYNRSNYLRKCLKAVAKLDTDPTIFEIMVVDNNSTDDTRQVCREFRQSHPGLQFRYLNETKQGVSHARNRAIVEACGDILCFLDDDSPPMPQWLNNLLKSFGDERVGCAGGPSILDFNGQSIPPWLRGDLQSLLSAYGLPYKTPTQITRWDEFPFACNMAIRRKVFSDTSSLRVDLGRFGRKLLTGAETELINRISKVGWKVMYIPDAQVHHQVAPERLEKSYIYRIGYGFAASHVILTSDPNPWVVLRWFASDLWYTCRMFFRLVVALLRRKPLWFDDYMRYWIIAQRIPFRIKSLFHKRIVPK